MKMKKMPVYLAMLGAATVGMPWVGGMAMATGAGDGAAGGEAGVTTMKLEANAIDPRITFSLLEPKASKLHFSMNYVDPEGRCPTRAVMLLLREGVRTEEADAGLLAFDGDLEAASAWGWNGMVFTGFSAGQCGEIESGVIRPDDYLTSLLQGSPADLLYYAIELTAPGAEPEWIKGKLDYRSCVHSQKYGSSGGTCKIRQKGDVYSILPDNVSASYKETVMTWDEERAVLARPNLTLYNIGLTRKEQQVNDDEIPLTGAEKEELWAAFEEMVGRIETQYYATDVLSEEIEALRVRTVAITEDKKEEAEPAPEAPGVPEPGEGESPAPEAPAEGGDGEGDGPAPEAPAEGENGGGMPAENGSVSAPKPAGGGSDGENAYGGVSGETAAPEASGSITVDVGVRPSEAVAIVDVTAGAPETPETSGTGMFEGLDITLEDIPEAPNEVANVPEEVASEVKVPKTGEKKVNLWWLIGLPVMAVGAALGLFGMRKWRKKDDDVI